MSWTFTSPASLSPILLGALRALICAFGQIRFARTIAKFNGPVAEVILLSKGLAVRWIQVLISSASAISIFSFSSVAAQSAFTGGLTGVVSDPDGAVVSNVTVEITNERTGKVERSINSEADGSYSATLLPPVFRFPNVVNIRAPSTFTRITETAIPARLIQFGLRYSL